MKLLLSVCAFWLAGLSPVSAQIYTFTPWAGSAFRGYVDGVGAVARFSEPRDVTVDANGNLYVLDNLVIRKITPAGVVTTFAGAANQYGNRDGFGGDARFNSLRSIAADRAGNLYVADRETIRKVTPAGLVTTLAGVSGESGSVDGTGAAARFAFGSWDEDFYEGGVAVDRDGNVYVADSGNHTIRKITSGGVVTTLAGSAGMSGFADAKGSEARFYNPARLTVDGVGNVFVTDLFNRAVRRISPVGEVTTIARDTAVYSIAADRTGKLYVSNQSNDSRSPGRGIFRVAQDGTMTRVVGGEFGSDDGMGSAARFADPRGITVDESGNIFVADTGNYAIRKVTSLGQVTTIAGDSPRSVDATGTEARFRTLRGIAIDPTGNLFVSDGAAIRKITPRGVVTTPLSTGIPADPNSSYWSKIPLAADGSGNIFFADTQGRALRKISSTGTVTTLATFSAGLATDALAVDREGNVYLPGHTDFGGNRITKVTPDGNVTALAVGYISGEAVAVNSRGEVFFIEGSPPIVSQALRKIGAGGTITTVAGNSESQGREDGPTGSARFTGMRTITIDGADNLFVMDERAIRKISHGVVTTLDATPTSNGPPYGSSNLIVVDAAGAIYIADANTNTIYKGVAVPEGGPQSRLTNASILANLRSGQALITGFNLRGSDRSVLVRAVGPGLQPFVSGTALAENPRLNVFDRLGSMVASNDRWGGGSALTAAFASAGAFPLAGGSADTALLVPMAGANTAHITSATNGLGLVELFDFSGPEGSGIINVSVRRVIGTGADATFTLGFTIEGTAAKTVLIRGIGPALASFAIADPLRQPNVAVFRGSQQIAANNRWEVSLTALFARLGAFPLPAYGNDAALLLTLEPGAYSAVLGGAGESTGEAMIEIYDVR